ncbi:LLM class flavin-dependent oxidoreductase [Actinomadura craniellae]|uniref:LLM class flavin-dependent oxidoreductase n=1 Tax=Actinomadura craniellae TaxID=2231787 RepID=A0A365H552_9ACTN|nr:LLM class flavin-dependent oxidoreductase [Actinomadura craniellae]RAY14126.1 LLM class flavin-dependent oxidoreductase [Actinomadura craniellae]
MAPIKVGTVVPMALDELNAPGSPSVPTAARYIEELGFESLWVPDLIIGDGTPALEAALTLAAAAAVTERIRIGFSVLTLPLRPAAWVAVQIATLQQLSNDRVLLGVGSGGFPDSPFWQAVGASSSERGARTNATLRALPQLLAGEPTELAPRTSPVTLAPAAPMPPVLVGGNSRTAMLRAVEFGGWFPSLISPDDLAPAVATLRNLAEERGVPAPGVTVGGHLIVGADESARSAKDALVRSLVQDHAMPPETAAKVPMTASTPAELAEVFAAYEAAGADRIVTGPDNGDYRSGLQLMMEAHAMLP